MEIFSVIIRCYLWLWPQFCQDPDFDGLAQLVLSISIVSASIIDAGPRFLASAVRPQMFVFGVGPEASPFVVAVAVAA